MVAQVNRNIRRRTRVRKPCTRAQAGEVASLIREYFPRVKEVFLFGSVMRDGVGKDLDLILVMDRPVFDEYLELSEPEDDIHLSSDHIRWIALEMLLSQDGTDESYSNWNTFREGVISLGMADEQLDLRVLPPDWRQYLPEIQLRIGHHDPKFMETVAREAVHI